MLSTRLQDGLDALGIGHDADQVQRLTDYLALLQKWNRAYNLTAITDPQRMVAYHLLDSLAIVDAIPSAGNCLDVGTGAGLPGIPLAIMLPDSAWTLLDSNGKKTRFVQQAIAHCRLSNVKVVQSRVQDYHADSNFDAIVSRAYASLADFVASVEHLAGAETRLISMKTELADSELEQMKTLPYQLHIAPLRVPGIAEKRSLATLERKTL